MTPSIPTLGQVSEGYSASPTHISRTVVAGRFSANSNLLIPEVARLHLLAPNELKDIWDRSVLRGDIPTIEEPESARSPLGIVDLFSGCGGLTAGVIQATQAVGLGATILAAADSSPNVLEVYDRNFGCRLKVQGNLWELIDFQVAGQGDKVRFVGDPKVLDSHLVETNGQVDLLLGGPPCEGHSNFNNHSRRDDPRNVLYLVMPAAAVALQAKTVIVENVPGIIHDRRGVVQTARRLFQNAGYLVEEKVVDVLRLGVPQTRKRHLMVASRNATPPIQAALDCLERAERTLEWAIGDLLDRAAPSLFDSPPEFSAENRQRIQYLFDTDLYDLPNAIRPKSHKNGHTYPSVYGRLKWHEPAGTITTGFVTPGRGRFIHPLRPRTLTAHEAARLQGFSDTFEFMLQDGSVPARTWLASMIGDAVPPVIGYAAGLAAISTIGPTAE